MGRETTDGSQEETTIEQEQSARGDPDSTPGLVVDKRPEKWCSTHPVLFWFTVVFYVLFAGVWAGESWLLGHVGTLSGGGDTQFDTFFSVFFKPLRRALMLMAIGPLLFLVYMFAARSAGQRGKSTTKVKWALSGVAVVLGYAIVVALPLEIYGYSTLELMPAFLLLIAGMILVMLSNDPNARVALHCRKCDYEFVPGEDAPRVCPECGRNWLRRRGLVKRRHQKKLTPLKITGVMLQVLACLAWLSVGKLHALVPTDWLIPRAGHPYSLFPPSDWAKLHPSNLTDEQLVRLAEVLLDKREAGKDIDTFSSDAWFEAALTANQLSEDVVRRLHHHWFRFEISAPTESRVGVPFETALDVWWQPRSFASRTVWIVFGGFRLDDEGPVGRMVAARAPTRIGRTLHMGSDATANPDSPAATFTPETPGQHSITAEYWLIAMDGTSEEPAVIWNADGSLAQPPESLYFRRFEISKTIEVLPG